jgi:tRNA threonylcarbamoyl adenosine modification protein (Sua5/YciO/YrdC/YwlC family)
MERIDLSSGDIRGHIALALKAIRDGYVICVPGDNGYLLIADAFSEFAVRALHVVRGDELGVSAQVLIHSPSTLSGIAREVTEDIEKLAEKFWPGPLSLNLRPQRGLTWDLGDNNDLDRFSVRVPQSEFLLSLLKESGPLASASASRAGEKAILSADNLPDYSQEIALICDGGRLLGGEPTTIVQGDSSGMTIIREGAISHTLLAEVAPAISLQ